MGFSLRNALVGVALTVVLVLAITPPIIRSRVAANEAEAIGDSRTIISAEQAYASANCGYFVELTTLCRVGAGADCRGIGLSGYDGPDFLDGELARKSPYLKAGYERAWTRASSTLVLSTRDGCSPAALSAPDYCYASTPVSGWSGVRSFSATGIGAIYHLESGEPIPCPIPANLWCVLEGSSIQTPSGIVAVESLRAGDEILGFGGGGERVNRVTAVRGSIVDEYLRMTFSSGRALELTGVHPVATPSGFRSAGTLEPGDLVLARNGLDTLERVEAIRKQVSVYDLTVEPDATFFANGILVHNKSIE